MHVHTYTAQGPMNSCSPVIIPSPQTERSAISAANIAGTKGTTSDQDCSACWGQQQRLVTVDITDANPQLL